MKFRLLNSIRLKNTLSFFKVFPVIVLAVIVVVTFTGPTPAEATVFANKPKKKKPVEKKPVKKEQKPLPLASNSLVAAVQNGDAVEVEQRLKNGGKANALSNPDREQATSLLQLACASKHLKVIELLIDHGADLEFRKNEKDNTVLTKACLKLRVTLVKLLLKKGASILQKVPDKGTLLDIPLSHYRAIIWEELFLVLYPHFQKSQKFQKQIRNKKWFWENIFARVCSSGFLKAAKQLHADGVSSKSALHYLINWEAKPLDKRAHQILTFLFSINVDLEVRTAKSKNSETPLLEACRYGNVDLVRIFIAKGAKTDVVDRYGFTILDLASGNCRTSDVLRFLLNRKVGDYKSKKQLFSSLLYACENGTAENVRLLLQHGADPNFTTTSKETPLLRACCHRRDSNDREAFGIVKLLMKYQPNVNVVNTDGETPLLGMCGQHTPDTRVIELLLKAGANPNIKVKPSPNYRLGDLGTTALHQLAQRYSRRRGIELLIQHGADVNSQMPTGETQLHIAIKRHSSLLVRLLLENGAKLDVADKKGVTPLQLTLDYRKKDIFCSSHRCIALYMRYHILKRQLKRQKAGTQKVNWSEPTLQRLLKEACRYNEIYLIEYSLAHDAKPDLLLTLWGKNRISKLLESALRYEHSSLIHTTEYCLRRMPKVSINTTYNRRALHLLFLKENAFRESPEQFKRFVQQLVIKGADLHSKDNGGLTPIDIALKEKHPLSFCGLIRCLPKAQLETLIPKNSSIIYFVCQNGLVKALDLLLEQRVNFIKPDKKGRTPLELACTENTAGHAAVVKVLLDEGISVDNQNVRGETVLHIASQHGAVGTVKLLLQAKATVSSADENGSQPLHFAAEHGQLAVVKLLLAAGADIAAKNKKGETAFIKAKAAKQAEVVEFLEKSVEKSPSM